MIPLYFHNYDKHFFLNLRGTWILYIKYLELQHWNYTLFGGRVPPDSGLFGGTVPPNSELLSAVPPNDFFLLKIKYPLDVNYKIKVGVLNKSVKLTISPCTFW